MKIRTQRSSGLSLVEVLAIVAALTLLAALLIPTIPRSPARGQRISCTSNLKQVGLAARLWANDHDNGFPWVSTNATGSLAFANSPQVFRHYAAMSNELVTPKVLACPTDRKRVKATDFAKFSNANLSYFVGLDADESKPQRLLSGDRNITGGVLSNRFLRLFTLTNAASWTTEMHNRAGNVGLADGSVQQVTDRSLQRQLEASALPLIRLAIP